MKQKGSSETGNLHVVTKDMLLFLFLLIEIKRNSIFVAVVFIIFINDTDEVLLCLIKEARKVYVITSISHANLILVLNKNK